MRGRLWHSPEFLKLWGGQAVSVVGDQVGALALPLAAVLVLDASATQMGVLTAAVWAPHLLLSLVLALWVDRRPHRGRIMVGADVARALVLATVPLAYWLDSLTIGHLIGVAFVVGAFTVLFQVAYSAYFVCIVDRADLVEANAKMSATRSASFIVGPSLGGVLVQVLTAPVTLLVDAISFLGSALLIRWIRVAEPPLEEPSGEGVRRRLAEGFRFNFGHPLLRAGLGCAATINFFNFGFAAIVVLFMADVLGLSAATIGLALGAGAVGGLVGAAVGPAVGRAVGMGPAIVLGSVLFPAPLLLFPLATGPEPVVIGMVVAGEFLAGLGVMIFDIFIGALIVGVTPHRLRPRQYAAFNTVNYGVRPIGALLGAALGAAIGLRPALVLMAAGAVLGVLWLLASPTPRLREQPEPAV
jgi:MFS family permease